MISTNNFKRLIKRNNVNPKYIFCKSCFRRRKSAGEKGPASTDCVKCKTRRFIAKTCQKCNKRKNRDCKCRQGRNHTSRDKKASINTQSLIDYCVNFNKCNNCGEDLLEYDFTSFAKVCYNCGYVVEDDNISDAVTVGDGTNIKLNKTKPYRTTVYSREKLRSLFGTDPPIWEDEWELIDEFVLMTFGVDYKNNPTFKQMGPKLFGDICKAITVDSSGFIVFNHDDVTPDCIKPLAKKKYNERWIQARNHYKLDVPEPLPIEFVAEICIKLDLFEKAHREKFQYVLTQKNCQNLNYVILQLIRMRSEDEFKRWRRYIKLSDGKLEEYNDRWKEMVQELSLNYNSYYHADTNSYFKVEWTYKPLYYCDIFVPRKQRYV